MKKKLISMWLEVHDIRAVGVENYAKKKIIIARIEMALWKRYGYDIALKFPFEASKNQFTL